MSHNDKRYLGLQIAAGVARRSASAYHPASQTVQSGHAAERSVGAQHDDQPTFTSERAANTRAYVRDWIQRHHGSFDSADVEAVLAAHPPVEI